MCTLRGGSNYSTTPCFFQKLCCTFSVLVSHIWGIKMNILQKLFQGKCIPVSEHGGNSSCEYEVAVEKLCKIAENLRQYGVPEELISALDKAENEILALEEKRMFRFAIRYRAELQRELMRKGQAIAACPFRYYAVFFFRSCSRSTCSYLKISHSLSNRTDIPYNTIFPLHYQEVEGPRHRYGCRGLLVSSLAHTEFR